VLRLSHLTSCTPTTSNLYLLIHWLLLYMNLTYTKFLTFHVPNLMSLSNSLVVPKISRGPRQMYLFRNKASFYGEELLAPRPHPSWGPPLVGCMPLLIHIFAATLHIVSRSSIRNLKTGTHLTWKGSTKNSMKYATKIRSIMKMKLKKFMRVIHLLVMTEMIKLAILMRHLFAAWYW